MQHLNPCLVIRTATVLALGATAAGCGGTSHSDRPLPEAGVIADDASAAQLVDAEVAVDADTTDASVPDLHAIPDDAEGGVRMCAVLANVCHEFDKGTDTLGHSCHEWGHEGDIGQCTEHYDECLAFCADHTPDATADAGHSHADAGHTSEDPTQVDSGATNGGLLADASSGGDAGPLTDAAVSDASTVLMDAALLDASSPNDAALYNDAAL